MKMDNKSQPCPGAAATSCSCDMFMLSVAEMSAQDCPAVLMPRKSHSGSLDCCSFFQFLLSAHESAGSCTKKRFPKAAAKVLECARGGVADDVSREDCIM